MQLELSRKAHADLDDIRDYSVRQFGPLRTIAYFDAIEQTFRRIVTYPEIGTAYAALGGVRSLPIGEHRVYYEVVADKVLIVRVLHKAMDVGRHL